jgi:hypothetical protein
VLISNRTFVPPIDTVAAYSIAWTEEALRRMDKVPSFARGVAKTAVHRFAVEKGHTIITNSVIEDALGHILPEGAMKAMMGLTRTMAEKKVDQEMAKELDYFICDGCGYIAKGSQPVKCPICSAEGSAFQLIDKKAMQEAVEAEGGVEVEKAFDDVRIEWTSEARARLREVPSGYIRRRAKAVIEKTARKMGLRTITLDLASKTIVEYAGETSWKDEILAGSQPKPSPATPTEASQPKAEAAPDVTLNWTPEALQRLDRVPEGYMRESTRKGVQKHAQEKGITTITLEVCQEGIEKAKVLMEEAMKNPQALEELLKNLGKK